MKKTLSWSVVSMALLAVACGGNHDAGSSQPSYASGETVVNIKFAEYDSVSNGYLDAFVYGYDGLNELPPTPVGADGSLSLTFDLNGDAVLNMMSSSSDERYGSVRIAPGETIDVTLYPDSVSTTGKYATLNSVMYNYLPKYSLNMFMPDFVRYDMPGQEYSQAVIGKYKEMKDSLAADTSLSDEARVIEEGALLNSVLGFMSMREMINRSSYMMTHPGEYNIQRDSMVNKLDDADYAAVVAAIDADSEALLKGGLEISTSLNGVDWSAKGANGTLLGIISDYQLAAKEASECRTDSARMATLTAYSNPFFASSVDNIRNAAQKRFDDAVSMINQLPADLPGDKVIETIAAAHKDKVVMVDLWNTWCSPCKAAIAANEPLKETLFNNPDIVFVYVADESSPMNLYVNMIPKIKGEHYRITAKQADAMRNQFDVDGIPYYILVDREGKIQGRPDFRDHDLYTKTLLETLNKK